MQARGGSLTLAFASMRITAIDELPVPSLARSKPLVSDRAVPWLLPTTHGREQPQPSEGQRGRLYESAALLAFSSRVRWPNQAAPSAGQAGPTKAWAQLRSVANLHEKRTQPKSKKKKVK
ncbi:hypothetical protein VTN96DRAFT_9012 [Rasamsonia emersonii]